MKEKAIMFKSPEDSDSSWTAGKRSFSLTPKEIVNLLDLKPVERIGKSGLFRQTYVGRDRLSNAIYYFLKGEHVSRMHFQPVDKMIHYYLGTSPVEILILHPGGRGEVVTLSQDLKAGHRPQVLVKRGNLQGARLLDGSGFALLGETCWPMSAEVTPTTESAEELEDKYPEFKEDIEKLA